MEKPNIIVAEFAFFKVMSYGYASISTKVEKTTIEELPGAKAITYTLGRFRIKDIYFVTPYSNKSAGSTVIWHDEIPIWQMSYGGRYPKEVVPFLKECLRESYIKKEFNGGRGPKARLSTNKEYVYVNSFIGNFASFCGREAIYSTDNDHGPDQEIGYHTFNGMSLL